ncbi:hypothetical protein B0H66DRAFT_179237 [Apodospora peruviana]|uniref:MPN domain-containing protein n=1 Tax=Apodospora peruviana TaxID=516989 RepID=A0AAE0M6X1_9PEZI|nr:hypothetical protein B0H66DRAFT_179237 [Apodospora peruviana]
MDTSDLDVYGQPMSVKELTEKAKHYDWNPRIGFKYWARAAETIHHEGQVYLHEGNLAQAYLFLLRYSMLVLDNLAKHPEAKAPEARKAVKPLQKRIPAVIEQLEDLRPQLDASYDEWLKVTAAQRDSAKDRASSKSTPYSRHAANDAALSWNHASPAKLLDAAEHQELAVDLARGEMSRRRRAAGLSEDEERRRRGAGFWDGWNSNSQASGQSSGYDDDELRRQIEATRRQLDRSDDLRSGQPDDGYSDVVPTASYYYPSIRKSTPFRYDSQSSTRHAESSRPQPPRPPKETLSRSPPTTRYPPALPRKEPIGLVAPVEDTRPSRDLAPTLPPKLTDNAKQKRVTFRPAAYLENGNPVRPVFLPSNLRRAFLDIAADNTRKGLEMCGILCGTPVNNALFISCLIIPEQKCTSDTCETENESAMLDYCINQDLLVIGWIHTHPTQTCFMSSRDLHTQAGYQVMMPESIAIVCAPRHEPSWGIFRLTNPPGLPHILACQHNDTFHQHSINNIYTDASQPAGHVYESKSLEFEVQDLRPKL